MVEEQPNFFAGGLNAGSRSGPPSVTSTVSGRSRSTISSLRRSGSISGSRLGTAERVSTSQTDKTGQIIELEDPDMELGLNSYDDQFENLQRAVSIRKLLAVECINLALSQLLLWLNFNYRKRRRRRVILLVFKKVKRESLICYRSKWQK